MELEVNTHDNQANQMKPSVPADQVTMLRCSFNFVEALVGDRRLIEIAHPEVGEAQR